MSSLELKQRIHEMRKRQETQKKDVATRILFYRGLPYIGPKSKVV